MNAQLIMEEVAAAPDQDDAAFAAWIFALPHMVNAIEAPALITSALRDSAQLIALIKTAQANDACPDQRLAAKSLSLAERLHASLSVTAETEFIAIVTTRSDSFAAQVEYYSRASSFGGDLRRSLA